MLDLDGKYYWTGKTWIQLDPVMMRARELGPGLRIDGKLADTRIPHFKSAILGLAARSGAEGCFFRFSIDPAKPAPVRATLDVETGQEIPAGGIIDIQRYPEPRVNVFSGEGAVSINKDGVTEITTSSSWRLPLAQRASQIDIIRSRISNSASLGLGVTGRHRPVPSSCGCVNNTTARSRIARSFSSYSWL